MALIEAPSPNTIPGLTSSEAEERFVEGQSNAVSAIGQKRFVTLFKETVFNIFNFDLLGIGLALWLLGRPLDALISMLVLLANMTVSLLLGYRNWRQIDRLLALTASEATVIRDNQLAAVDPDLLVPGDAVVIGTGDQFFADGVLLEGANLRLDDYAVNKSETFVTVEPGEALYAGSFCVTGHGVYRVTAVDQDRRLESLSGDPSRAKVDQTPLQQLITHILTILRVLVIIFLAATVIRYFIAPDVSDELYTLYVDAVSVIFTIAPSGLLFMILVTYASGAAQLRSLGALVKNPRTVEALAQADILCLGKIGTLTGGQADLLSLVDEEAAESVSDTRLRQLVGSFARSASRRTALLQVLADSFPGTPFDPVQEAPFLSLVGWQALTFSDEEMPGTYVLGFERFMGPLLDPQLVPQREENPNYEPMLFAYVPAVLDLFAGQKEVIPPQGLIPLARILLDESVRTDAVATTQAFLDAGITIKILSSDTVPAVVRAAESTGLVTSSDAEAVALSSRELNQVAEEALYDTVMETHLYGRLGPHQKERVVETLTSGDLQVAMLGETVMEVPAMRAADIGITMHSSNQAAVNEAEIILLGESLDALPQVLALGQGIFNRLLDALKLSLTHALMVCWLAALVLLGLIRFPYLASHNLPIVLFTITIPSFVLSFWLVSGRIDSQNLARRLLYFVLPASLTVTALVILVFLYILERSSSPSYAHVVVAHTLVLSGLVLILFVQPPLTFFAGGDSGSGDRRPLHLVLVLYLVFLVLAQTTPVRSNAFPIGALRSLGDLTLVWGATSVWALSLRGIWRLPALRRLARFSLEPAGELIVPQPAEPIHPDREA